MSGCSEGHSGNCDSAGYCDGGGKEVSCFPAGTKILSPKGSLDIATIQEGDPIFSWSGSTLVTQITTKVLAHRSTTLTEFRFNKNRSPLLVTGFHTMLTKHGWLRASKIKRGDFIFEAKSRMWVEIDQIFTRFAYEKVYNLVTTGEHNFIAEGFVAHNFTFFRRTRTMFHQLFLDRYFETSPAKPDFKTA